MTGARVVPPVDNLGARCDLFVACRGLFIPLGDPAFFGHAHELLNLDED